MADKKGRNGSGLVRMIIIIALLAVIAYCLYNIVPYVWSNLKEKNAYDQMSQEYTQADPEFSDEDWWYTDVQIDVAGLKAKYPDVVGWIRFDHPDDTIRINYPILYSGDDDTYLHRDLDNHYSYPGCIFLEGGNKPDFSDQNSIVYGHNMRNGTMFGTLKHFSEDGIYESNRFFTVYTAKKAYRYQVFSCFTTDSRSNIYTIGFGQDAVYQDYLNDLADLSEIHTGIVPSSDQKIILLSTCRGAGTDYRYVVCGVCEDEHDYPV